MKKRASTVEPDASQAELVSTPAAKRQQNESLLINAMRTTAAHISPPAAEPETPAATAPELVTSRSGSVLTSQSQSAPSKPLTGAGKAGKKKRKSKDNP